MSTTTKSPLVQPALIGGLVMGVLSALPIISLGNACCCLWVVAGGLVAAYVLQQNQTTPIQPGDGALVGLLAGMTGAIVQSIVSVPITLFVGPMERELVRRIIDMAGTVPPEVRERMEEYGRGEGLAAFWLVSRFFALMFWVFIGAIFSTLGGLLGAAIFRKNPPPGTVDAPGASPA